MIRIRKVFLCGLLHLCGLGALAQTPKPSSPARPDIVLILVDDMGYSDLGCYGGEIPTPHIDALAAGGMRFRTFYNAAQCCPTRASLLTGRYPHEVGIGDMIDQHSLAVRTAAESPHYSDHLDPETPTIAESLRTAGYQTYMTGKWHLGGAPGQRPRQRGFDRYYGILGGADSYRKPLALFDGDTPIPPQSLPSDYYTTDAFTTKAVEFIAQGEPGKPYFLYLAYNAVHSPFQAPPAAGERFRGRYDAGWDVIRERRFARQKEIGLWPAGTSLPNRDPSSRPWRGTEEQRRLAGRMEVYAAMLAAVDENIGRLVDALRRRGSLDNTLILLLSDNGAWASDATYGQEWAETGNTPFRLFKLFTHEGGVATPFIAHWPKRIPAGAINTRQYAHVKDVAPTLREVAGADGGRGMPSGRSILKAMLDPDQAHDESLFWERMGNGAVRDGKWKLVRTYNANRVHHPEPDQCVGFGRRTGAWELYDLETDPTETRNLADTLPELANDLASRHAAWERLVGVVPREVIVERIKTRGLTNER